MDDLWKGQLEVKFESNNDLSDLIKDKIIWRRRELNIETKSIKLLSRVGLKYVTLKGGLSVALCYCFSKLYPELTVCDITQIVDRVAAINLSSETTKEIEFINEVKDKSAGNKIQHFLQTHIPKFGLDFDAYKSLRLGNIHLKSTGDIFLKTEPASEKAEHVKTSTANLKPEQSPSFSKTKPNSKEDPTIYSADELMTGDDSSYYLGKGTYGVVRKCHHPTLKVVAVKCLNIQQELGSKLPPEARYLLEARDDFVVQLHGICKWPFSLGLVMEFVEGGSLDLLLFDHSVSLISWQLKVRIVHQISCGLASMHEKNIVHGDLKSSNILLDSNMVPKLADFGAAVVANFAGSLSTEETENQFTVAYSAPEVLLDGDKRKKSKMDVYSFAIVVYEIAARSAAFPPHVLTNIDLFRDAIISGNRPDIDEIEEKQKCFNKQDKSSATFLSQLIEDSWVNDPGSRPDMKSLCERILHHKTAENHDEKLIQEHVLEIKSKQNTSSFTKAKESPLIPIVRLAPPSYDYSSAVESYEYQESQMESETQQQDTRSTYSDDQISSPGMPSETNTPLDFEEPESNFGGISIEEMIQTMGVEEDAEEMFREKRFKDAVPLLHNSIKGLSDVHKSCMMRLKLAVCYYEMNERETGDRELKQALADLEKPVQSSSEIRGLGNRAIELADSFVKSTRLSRALLIYKSAATVFCQCRDSNIASHGIGKCIRRLQEHFTEANLEKHSLGVMQFLLEKLSAITAVSAEVMTRSFHDAGYFYDGVNEYETAIECYQKAIKAMDTACGEDAKYQNIYAQCYHNMGVTYKNMNQLKKALECFTRSLELYQASTDWSDENRKKKTVDKNIRSVENLRLRLLTR